MASFPGSVKSFTTKNTGDVVQASHVNDLQDEVNAIEDGYVNGTARLNSSNSTVARLNVSGASTFVVRPIMPPPDCALVYLDSTVTIGSSAQSTLSWLQDGILTNSSMHSTTSNPDRLIPQSTGIYHVSAQLSIGMFASTGTITIAIRDSSGNAFANMFQGVSSQSNILQLNGYKRFDVLGGYALCVLAPTGQSTVSVSTGIGLSWFSMVKL